MKNIILKYGLGSGIILGAMTAIMLPLCMKGVIDFSNSELLGYSTMVLCFLFVFFGIRGYREEIGGGSITFGRAFQVGIGITLVSCAIYVLAWEIVYYGFIPDFMDRYAEFTLQKMRDKGEAVDAIVAAEVQMAEFKEMYKNPLFNIAVTFMEVFPVGLIVTLVSAAILRKRPLDVAPAMEAAG